MKIARIQFRAMNAQWRSAFDRRNWFLHSLFGLHG
jgi:hypothetical protein